MIYVGDWQDPLRINKRSIWRNATSGLLREKDGPVTGDGVGLPLGLASLEDKKIVFADDFAGANMGAKIQAAVDALTSGGHIIVPLGSHAATAKIDVDQANLTIEFLRGAVLSANGDFICFDVSANRVKFIAPCITGSNNVAHTSNIGINIQNGVSDVAIHDPYIYQTYYGVFCAGTSCENIQIFEGHIDDTKSAVVLMQGTRNVLVGVRADTSVTGYILRGECEAIACEIKNATYSGFYISNAGGTRVLCVGCKAVSSIRGFFVRGAAGVAQYVTLIGCEMRDNATNGFQTADTTAGALHLVLKGNRSICTATQAHTFRFFRDVGSLVYVGNDTSGFSTAAEYWHPDLDKADFEIGHNYEG